MPSKEHFDAKEGSLEHFKESWSHEDDWDLITLAGMRFNRAIVYPSSYFHSRYPLKGWGDKDKPEECRLIGALFFHLQ